MNLNFILLEQQLKIWKPEGDCIRWYHIYTITSTIYHIDNLRYTLVKITYICLPLNRVNKFKLVDYNLNNFSFNTFFPFQWIWDVVLQIDLRSLIPLNLKPKYNVFFWCCHFYFLVKDSSNVLGIKLILARVKLITGCLVHSAKKRSAPTPKYFEKKIYHNKILRILIVEL